MNRRDFMKAALVGSGAMALERNLLGGTLERFAHGGGGGTTSPIQHVVLVTMENRSFDHFLGWLPSPANATEAGSYPKTDGTLVNPFDLGTDYKGCSYSDPDHSYAGARTQYDGGAMDGFLKTSPTTSDVFPVGYDSAYDSNSPISFLAALAQNYTVLDNYFCSFLGPTYPNRLFMHSATTDRLDDSTSFTNLPTIWDRLAGAGVSRAYYYNNYSFLSLWSLFKYSGISKSYSQFLSDCSTGKLPAVSYVDPTFEPNSDDGTGTDDHPHADIRRGDAWLAQTFYAVASNAKLWASTVFILVFDEWGGFFDHVAPPRVTPPTTSSSYVDQDQVNGKVLLGFRVPAVVASPWSRNPNALNASDLLTVAPRVVSTLFDHTSILKLIESRWKLQPLTLRDAPASEVGDLTSALDFTTTNKAVPAMPQPAMPAAVGC